MKIEALYAHPFKSFGAMEVQEAKVTPAGFELDRRFIPVNAHYGFVSQLRYPELCLVRPQLDGDFFTLTAPGLQPIKISAVPEVGLMRQIRVHDMEFPAYDQGNLVSEWLSTYLHDYIRLMGLPDVLVRARQIKEAETDMLVWGHDSSPISIVSTRTRDAMEHIFKSKIDIRRFRPSVVTTPDEADVEQTWGALEYIHRGCAWSHARTIKRKLVERCPVIDVNPDTGKRDINLDSFLKVYRPSPYTKGKGVFGVYHLPDFRCSRFVVGDLLLGTVNS